MRLLADARYSIRSFSRTPALTLALLGSIALGIGSNGAVFAYMRGLVGGDVPLDRLRSVVSVFTRGDGDSFGAMSLDDVAWLAEQRDIFAAVGGVLETSKEVEAGGRRHIVSAAAMTSSVPSLLPVDPGDGLLVTEALRRDVRLAADFTRADAGVTMDGRTWTVRGTAPAWLDSLYRGRQIDVWYVWPTDGLTDAERGSRSLWGLARLQDGMTPTEAERVLADRRRDSPAVAVRAYTGLSPEADASHARTRRLLFAATGVVVLVACVNVMVFLLSRGSARSQEVSIRVALGASRRQLARQLLMDSAVLAISGGILGALLAIWTADFIPSLFYSEDAAALVQAPDIRTVAIASAICAGVMAICALVPLIEVRDDDPAAVLRRESGGPSNTMRRLRSGLVAAQMAGCCLLVISAGLLVEGFRSALRTRAGHELGPSLMATVQAGKGEFGPVLSGTNYFRRVEATIRELPDVKHVAWTNAPPGARPNWQQLQIEPAALDRRPVSLRVENFDPASTFETMALEPAAGRMFGGADSPTSCPSVMVNDAASRVLGDDIVGKVLETTAGRRFEIVGVISRKDAAVAAAPAVYFYADHIQAPVPPGSPALLLTPVRPEPMPSALLDVAVVTPGTLEAMGLAVIDGRPLPDRAACGVAVVNESANEQYFGGRAVGAVVLDPTGRRFDITGVVRSTQFRASQRRPEPTVYFPLTQKFQPRMSAVIAVAEVSDRLRDQLIRRLSAVDGGFVWEVTSLDDHLARTALAPERIATTLVVLASWTALAIGVLGMYGAMADATRRRRREIALRIALGARGWRVIRPIAFEGVRLAAIGLAVGTIGSLAVAAWLRGIAPQAAAPALWIWFAAPLALLSVVVIAGVLPARRALAVNPLTIMAN